MRRRRRPGGGVLGGAAPYAPSAVALDGTNDYIESDDAAPLDDSKNWTGSIWFRYPHEASFDSEALLGASAASRGLVILLATNFDASTFTVQFLGYTPAGTLILNSGAISPAITLTGGGWHHLMYSIGIASSSTRWVYLDGVAVTTGFAWSTYTDAALGYGSADLRLGAHGASLFEGDLGPVALSNTLTDLSVAGNRAKFIADGLPVQPVPGDWPIVFDGDETGYATNLGTLGDAFTLVGALGEGQTPVALPS